MTIRTRFREGRVFYEIRTFIPSFLLMSINPPRFGNTGGLQGVSGLLFLSLERDEPLRFYEQLENVSTKALQQFQHAVLLRCDSLGISLLSHRLP